VEYFGRLHLAHGIVEDQIITATKLFIMEKTKNINFTVLPIVISLLMAMVVLTNEGILPKAGYIAIVVVLLGLSLYYVPYRMIINKEIILSKGLDLASNLILGLTCAYISLILFTRDPNVITAGHLLVIASSIFSYYIMYIRKDNSKMVFIAHFIVTFFLIGLLQFSK
jgi:hypothetical protein